MYNKKFKLDKAEIVLHKIREELQNKSSHDPMLSQEFFATLGFKKEHRKRLINTRRLLSEYYDMCQILRDMINIGEETDWNLRTSAQAIYRSIGTYISRIAEDQESYKQIEQLLTKAYDVDPNKPDSVDIVNIYEVVRPNESFAFNRDNLGNVQLLFHGSRVNNFVGILSRGLLVPRFVSNEINNELERTDQGINRYFRVKVEHNAKFNNLTGMLGYGIYFSDSLRTSLKYTRPSRQKNTRLVAVCEVALGACCDYTDFDITLTKSPPGYNSTHGNKSLPGSKFVDDEFVIYDVCQYKLRYIAELQLNPTDQMLENKPIPIEAYLTSEVKNEEMELGDSGSLEDAAMLTDQQQQQSFKSSLKSVHGKAMPLKSVHVRVKIVDMSAKVCIFQEYENEENEPIEAEYLFPLNDGATVCGFEAFINDKHVVGVCKERKEAHREYKEAIRQGMGAYLMDQETNEIFKVNVGNLPPKCKCVIKITYLTELDVQDDR